MKYANKIGAKYSIVIGEDEAKSNSAILKNMNTKTETSVSLENADDILKAVMEEK